MRSAVTKKKQAQTRATECCVLFAMLPVRGGIPPMEQPYLRQPVPPKSAARLRHCLSECDHYSINP